MARRDPLNTWLVAWINKQYPDKATFSRPDARLRAYRDMPHGHVPSIDKLVWDWFTKRFNDVLTDSGFVFPEGHRGKTIARQDMLPWDEESKVLIEQLRLAATDIGAVRARLVSWAAVNDPTMDIDKTMTLLLAAAGL